MYIELYNKKTELYDRSNFDSKVSTTIMFKIKYNLTHNFFRNFCLNKIIKILFFIVVKILFFFYSNGKKMSYY